VIFIQNQIVNKMGIQFYKAIIVADVEGLWRRASCEDSKELDGVTVRHVGSEMELRRVYEWDVLSNPDNPFVIVMDCNDVYVPADIARRFHIYRLTYDNLFPYMNSRAIRDLPGLDYNRISVYSNVIGFQKMSYDATIKFCTETVMKDPKYARDQMRRAVELSENASTHRVWSEIAELYGRAAHDHHTAGALENFDQNRHLIEDRFKQWVFTGYSLLSGSVDKKRPVLLSKAADYIRKESDRAALIVMDGMSFENFYTVQDYFVNEPFEFMISSSYSFLPSVTCVARQSIFSGQLPRENMKPFSLDNEEKQWRTFWENTGLKENEIGFYKTDNPAYDKRMKALGIVITICDDLMHAELQGLSGFNQGVVNRLRSGALKRLLTQLLADGYKIFMTSDHGNTSAIAQGRFIKPGLVAESASRRAVIYQNFDDAPELNKFDVVKYSGGYLPDGYDAYLFDTDACYGDTGKEYITHGGMTIEEMIVPFVKIGAYNG